MTRGSGLIFGSSDDLKFILIFIVSNFHWSLLVSRFTLYNFSRNYVSVTILIFHADLNFDTNVSEYSRLTVFLKLKQKTEQSKFV